MPESCHALPECLLDEAALLQRAERIEEFLVAEARYYVLERREEPTLPAVEYCFGLLHGRFCDATRLQEFEVEWGICSSRPVSY